MELGCGSFVEMEWALLFFYLLRVILNDITITYSMSEPSAYFFFTLRNSSSARLGQNSRAKKNAFSSLICFMFARGNFSLPGESMTASLMHC